MSVSLTNSRPGSRVPLIALLVANAISGIGNALTAIAVPWFVLVTTGSAAQTGITAAVTTLPTIIAGVFGGTLVDRLGFRRTSIVADLASGATVASIPLLHATVGLAFWQLLILVFLGALLDAPGWTARQSLIPDLSSLSGMPLERANSAFQLISNLSGLVGPPLAGILIALVGASNVLWFDAASFAVSAAIVAGLVPAPARRVASDETPTSYLTNLKEGFAFVRSQRLVLAMLLVAAIMNFLGAPMFGVILPVYAREVLGDPVDLGIMIAGFSAGALVGALAYGAIGNRLPRRAAFVGAFMAASIPFVVLAMLLGWVVSTAMLAIVGMASGMLNPLYMTVIQERVPANLRGRVFGLVMAIAMVAMPLGMLTAGYLIAIGGLQATLIGIAAANLTVSTALLLIPTFHELNSAATTERPIDRSRRDTADEPIPTATGKGTP